MAKDLSLPRASTDMAAISISVLCLLHCLAVPLMTAMLPVFAVIEEAEWLHKLLVVASAPVSGLALLQMRRHFIDPVFLAAALSGLGMLFAAAFLERFHPHEKVMTFVGAALLISAHIWRWRQHHLDAYSQRNIKS